MADEGTSEEAHGLDRLDEIESTLKALASRNRLRLVEELRRPKTVEEIDLTPADPGDGDDGQGASDRQLTRQGVRHHLSRLEEAGLLRTSTRSEDEGRDRQEHVIDEATVFALLEELRDLVAPGTDVPLEPFQTEAGRGDVEETWEPGPKLVLLGGVRSDRVFHLQEIDPIEAPERGWVIGRSPEAQISLQYDPYLSAQNTELVRERDSFQVIALRTSRNGTVLNDRRLKPGSEERLEHGDVIRVGCSAMVFHRD